MKSLNKYILTFLALTLFLNVSFAQTAKYKCLLQMSNYQGLGAYVVVALINPQDQYEKTLYVLGEDKQWYNSLKEWHKSLSKKNEKLSAVTKASVAAGNRSMMVFDLDVAKFNKGYKLRFETAVEDRDYYTADVEIPLTTDGVLEKKEGTGFIRYVKLTPVQ